MPDVSIVVKATDQYSDALKTMQSSTQHFTKDLDGMQDKLNALSNTKARLQYDTNAARKELTEAQKQFSATGSRMDELAMKDKQLAFDNAQRNLRAVSKEMSSTASERERMTKTIDQADQAFSKLDNRAQSMTSGGGSLTDMDSLGGIAANTGAFVKAMTAQGIGSMVSGLGQDLAVSYLGSAYGEEVGIMGSSVLSSAANGAAIGASVGSIIPGVGTVAGGLVGSLVGGLAGAASGAAQIEENKNDSFRSYYQEAVETQLSAQDESLSSGSALAAQRETDRVSFTTLFGGKGIAETYLEDLVEMSNNTPFLYDDLTSMSKTLATYGYDSESILPVLQTVGDTGAALGMGTSDMTAVAQALGRMKSSDKTTLEYLNILNDRGVGAVGMLADAYGVDQGTMYEKISKGEIAGSQAVEIILDALTDSFAGSMLEQSKTFSGLTSTVEGLQQELDNAMGEGYNETRKAGLEAQRDWLNGESGESMQEAYRMMGQWQADLENTKEQLERDALNSVMTGAVADSFMDSDQKARLEELGQEYQDALASYNEGNEAAGAEMGRILAEAKIIALNEYNDTEGAHLALESELSLIESVRNDTALNEAYYSAGYQLGQAFSKGRSDGMALGSGASPDFVQEAAVDQEYWTAFNGGTLDFFYADHPGYTPPGYAVGLDYVPYDNFPALLHQGERVLTAEQARSDKGGGGVTIHIGTMAVREEADISKVASELLAQIELASMRG